MIDAISGGGISFGSGAFSQVQAYYAQNPGLLNEEKLEQAKEIREASNSTYTPEEKAHLLGALNGTQIGPFDINTASANAVSVLNHMVALYQIDPEFFETISGENTEFLDPKEAKSVGNLAPQSSANNTLLKLINTVFKQMNTGKIDLRRFTELLQAILKGQTPTFEVNEVKDFLAMLLQLLENGIEDLMELSMVSVLVALLGKNLPNSLLIKIQSGIEDFVKSHADKGTNYVEVLAFIHLVQQITSATPSLKIPAIQSIKQEAAIQQNQIVTEQFYDPQKSTDVDIIESNPEGELNPLALHDAPETTEIAGEDKEPLVNLGAQLSRAITASLKELGYSSTTILAAGTASGDQGSNKGKDNKLNAIYLSLLEEAETQSNFANAGIVTYVAGMVQKGLSGILDQIAEDSTLLET